MSKCYREFDTRSRFSIQNLISDTSGAVAVEFAIIFGAALLLLFGILEMGRAVHLSNAVEALADTAARTALLNTGCTLDSSDMLSLQQDRAGLKSENLTILPPTLANNYEVSVQYEFRLLIPFWANPMSLLEARKGIAPLCSN